MKQRWKLQNKGEAHLDPTHLSSTNPHCSWPWRVRARLTGGTISKHEAEVGGSLFYWGGTWTTINNENSVPKKQQMISDAYKKELHKFDTERALPAWDGLITKQQESLRRIGVPTIFPTAIPADREVRLAFISLPLHLIVKPGVLISVPSFSANNVL